MRTPAARGAAPRHAGLSGLGCFITAPIGADQGAGGGLERQSVGRQLEGDALCFGSEKGKAFEKKSL
jgi:hypothetical protein